MCGLCASLLEIAANPFKLSVLVPKFSTGREVGRTGGSDVDDAEVDTENCPVRVVTSLLDPFFGLQFPEAEIQIVVAVTSRVCGFREFLFLTGEVLVLVAIFVVQ